VAFSFTLEARMQKASHDFAGGTASVCRAAARMKLSEKGSHYFCQRSYFAR